MVFVGSGGVGKTTLAAAAGLLAARAGKKVLVLTIDPSRRLASTLGIEGSTEATKVPGFEGPGELWASIVDHRRTFDEFVMKAAKHAPGAEKILKNGLYRQLTTTLAGSQDFSALEKLYSCYKDGGYDVLILDTPPAQHAREFLEAPAKIAALFQEGIARWFRDPQSGGAGFLQKIVSTGTRQVLKVLETLTGSDFIRELGDFFRTIEGWQGRLQERTTAVHRLLVSDETRFYLVTGFDRAKWLEAESFARDIRQAGYHLGRVIVNRAWPQWLAEKTEAPLDPELEPLHQRFVEYDRKRAEALDRFTADWRGEQKVLRLPELSERVYDLQGLAKVAEALSRGGW
ncbi:MAG: ArsA family ATPase [Bdellovibrionaceae bacterium]|nr:ArsA family ATPase [Pseudobdellovibrionaceae bacterium]MBX3033779.1 ArsA family ATPase [Pseudobdellovibrionaceae bacterium]